MSFDFGDFLNSLPQGRVVPLRAIDIRLEGEPHPFEMENRAAIDAHWAAESAANPALFNGRMVLPLHAAVDNGVLTGASRPIDFATFLYWRRMAEQSGVHIFAHAVPVSADGAIVAVRMAPHTANPGRIYCAAGSFEPEDFAGGRMDFERNTHREVREETGIELDAVDREDGYGIVRTGRAVLVFRRYFLPWDAATLNALIDAHIAAQQESEIDAAVIIRKGDRPQNMAAHMYTLIDFHFGGAEAA